MPRLFNQPHAILTGKAERLIGPLRFRVERKINQFTVDEIVGSDVGDITVGHDFTHGIWRLTPVRLRATACTSPGTVYSLDFSLRLITT